jgi:hypothetical protein
MAGALSNAKKYTARIQDEDREGRFGSVYSVSSHLTSNIRTHWLGRSLAPSSWARTWQVSPRQYIRSKA